MDRYLVKIPITRKDFLKTKSSKFKGYLNIVTNKHGIIYDWKIDFTHIEIDLYTTPSWFEGKIGQTLFNYRQNLFSLIGLTKQMKRPSQLANNIKLLNDDEKNIVNDFFNDRSIYKSTIKNIVGVLKGNNPGGEVAKPSSAEMIIDDSKIKTNLSNFVILIDDLKGCYKSNINLFDTYSIGAKKITFNEYQNLNKTLANSFNLMQKSKSNKEFEIYLKGIKAYIKEYRVDIKQAESLISKSKSRYSKNIDSINEALPFGLKDKSQFQKAHIYDVHILKDKIIFAIQENKSFEKYLKQIEDSSNFLPLPESIHRKFDSHYFTYKDNGEVYPINEKGYIFVKDPELFNPKYQLISPSFLTPKRKAYLKKRNEEIIFD